MTTSENTTKDFKNLEFQKMMNTRRSCLAADSASTQLSFLTKTVKPEPPSPSSFQYNAPTGTLNGTPSAPETIDTKDSIGSCDPSDALPISTPSSIPAPSRKIKMEEDEVSEPPAKKQKTELVGFSLLFYQRPRTPSVTKSDIIAALNSIGLFGIPESAITPLCEHVKTMRTTKATWMIEFAVSEEVQSKMEEFVTMNQFVAWDNENSRPSKTLLCRLLDTPEVVLASLMALVAKVLVEKDPSSVIAVGRDQIKIGPYPNAFTFTLTGLLRTHEKEVDEAVKKISSRSREKMRRTIRGMLENPSQNS